jgi:hypothetical protein
VYGRTSKISIWQNLVTAKSSKVKIVFPEFIDSMPKAYCCWLGDTEEYMYIKEGTRVQASTNTQKPSASIQTWLVIYIH